MERRRLSLYEYTRQTVPMQSQLCALSIRKDSTLCLPTHRIDADELGTQRIATERRRKKMIEKNTKQLEHMYKIGVQLERKRIVKIIKDMTIETAENSAKTVDQILILIDKK